MAKLRQMPSLAIISGYKGSIDFYLWKGIPCARSWPRSPGHQRSPAVMAQWQAFTTASREWPFLSPTIQAAYQEMATDSGLTARDLQIRGYIGGLYRYPTP